jgi:hypothetical protein
MTSECCLRRVRNLMSCTCTPYEQYVKISFETRSRCPRTLTVLPRGWCATESLIRSCPSQSVQPLPWSSREQSNVRDSLAHLPRFKSEQTRFHQRYPSPARAVRTTGEHSIPEPILIRHNPNPSHSLEIRYNSSSRCSFVNVHVHQSNRITHISSFQPYIHIHLTHNGT